MKKRILIILPTLRNGGGVISGLKNMLSLLPTEKYDINVLPLGYSGGNNVKIENCKVLKDSFILTATNGVFNHCEKYKYKTLLWICKVVLTILQKIKIRLTIVNKLYQIEAKKYHGFDIVVGYQEGASTRFAQFINSPHRIAWIHCDYANYQNLNNFRNEESIYLKYNKIVCVSKYTLSNFVYTYPQLKERSTFVYNLIDIETIKKDSLEICEDVHFDKNITNIVSIGRINPVKQFHLIPQIISQILKNGVTNFRWILIGGVDSDALEQIQREVERYGITEEHFKYIGPQFNPYPYIKNSDILVSTSSSEACPFVVNEARVLGVPVVSNNYPSIYEFIKDGINGRICSIENMAQILEELISDKKSLSTLKQAMEGDKYNNNQIIRKICDLFDSK